MAPRGSKAAKVASPPTTEELPPPPPLPSEDRISALPDAVLQHALGFLPAQDAVRTCVLGQRWRGLWRSLPRLRITNDNAMFVNHLLLLREPGGGRNFCDNEIKNLALDHCEIDLRGCTGSASRRYVDLWIRHALLLRARVMHLRWVLRIELVHFDIAVDFSSCHVLEDLQLITSCDMDVCEIRSPSSARRLSLVNCTFGVAPWLENEYRAHICAPGLVCLEIQGCDGINPVLESMPLLQDASVWFNCSDEPGKSCNAGSCGGKGYTFRKDLGFCPTFNKLRTLYLVNWCLTSDISALLRFLHHTPNLEKLTLELCEKEMCSQLEIEDCNPIEPRILLRQLNTVKVIYCISVHIYFMLRQHVTIVE
ncbi:hypothetical protein BDA96_05G073600 [Sorghum bicolor]|uniref:F-box domain-containing protein n=1 Tax=Sorghum bicolor TaxID=4558 RepID=A0A921UG01_SORBI|nr:hypothetical protein BDA96_05G073600 [Sorghum bicolor]